MKYLFGILVFLIPGVMGLAVQHDISIHALLKKPKWKFTLCSSSSFFVNILLFYVCYLIGLITMRGRPISATTPGEYYAMLVVWWVSIFGLLISALTFGLAFLSEKSLARKLCIWGSVAALVFWPLVYFVASEFRADYVLHHR